MAEQHRDPSQKASDKRKLKEAALSRWVEKLRGSANRACEATGGYTYLEGHDREANAKYWAVIEKLKRLAEEFETIANDTDLLQFNHLLRFNDSFACESDDDCPDDYICVNGTCQSPFPGGGTALRNDGLPTPNAC